MVAIEMFKKVVLPIGNYKGKDDHLVSTIAFTSITCVSKMVTLSCQSQK